MVERTVTEKNSTRSLATNDHITHAGDVAVYDVVEPNYSRPMDRVRWGAVLAGLVTALSTLVLLSVLGVAVGLTTYETGDQLSNFGMGAGIWGAISTITAFILGGWVAARSAAVRGRGNALLNGAMVWAIAIPLIMYLLGSGVGSILNMATDAAATSATALTDVAPADANAAASEVQAQAQQIDPATVNAAAQNAGETAWGILAALLMGLIAALVGGLLGQREQLDVAPAI